MEGVECIKYLCGLVLHIQANAGSLSVSHCLGYVKPAFGAYLLQHLEAISQEMHQCVVQSPVASAAKHQVRSPASVSDCVTAAMREDTYRVTGLECNRSTNPTFKALN